MLITLAVASQSLAVFLHVLLWFYHKRKLIGCGIPKLTENCFRLEAGEMDEGDFRVQACKVRDTVDVQSCEPGDAFRDIFLSVTDVAWVDFITHQ